MAPNFVTGSKIFEITDYTIAINCVRTKCGIQSEHFTVGGYDWVIEFYPNGINETASGHISVFVKVLNQTKEFQAICNFFLWDNKNSKWQASPPSDLITFSPSGGKTRWGIERYYSTSNNYSIMNYLKAGETITIMCTLSVIPRLPAPAPALKPHSNKPAGNGNEYTKMPMQPTVRIYSEANKDLSVTICNGTVVLATADSNDYYQHWIKDMRYGDKKDVYGFPAFSLVNRVTGEALKNSAGENQEVSLVPYNPNHLEDSVKWSTDFRAIRIADMPGLNMTALASAGVDKIYDGAKIIVKGWTDSPVQHWNIVSYISNVPYKLISNL